MRSIQSWGDLFIIYGGIMKEIIFGVYSISHNGKLLYIGSTNNFDLRQKQHIKKLTDGKHMKTLQKYVDENVKDLSELKFKIVHKTLDNSQVRLFFSEIICIFIQRPLTNKPVLQFGMKFVQFARPTVKFDEKILKYL